MQFPIPVVLGLTSARRHDIICNNIGLSQVSVVDPGVDEDVTKLGKSPGEYVAATAEVKASAVIAKVRAGNFSFPLVTLCADTVVSCDDAVCEKPLSPCAHGQMLLGLRTALDIAVYTAVTVSLLVVQDGEVMVKHTARAVERTSLVFDDKVSDEQIAQYVASGDGSDAAGGFKVQLLGSFLFKGINGDFFNVVGLPVLRTCGLLREIANMID